jgi:hypothetical protein
MERHPGSAKLLFNDLITMLGERLVISVGEDRVGL